MAEQIMQCCFVNSTEPPKRIEHLGMFKYTARFGSDTIDFWELCSLTYPHPDAADEAVVTLLSWEPVCFPRGFEKTVISIVDGMKGLGSVRHSHHKRN